MKILGISGSPHKKGNTAFAVQYALDLLEKAGQQTEYISLSCLNINGCLGCWTCASSQKCVHNDDMENIYQSVRNCDVLILGSPVYMGMVSGQMKVFMDRCVYFRPSYEQAPELTGKIGCGIACGNFRNGGQETTLQNIHTFLLQQNLKVINDGAPYCHTGGTIVGDARRDLLGLESIANMAKNILVQAGK
jgi:multimeric flavodoxin WrbA